MTAFLSHSSRDKALVEEVASLLGLANIQLDSRTFDAGLLNVQVVRDALENSSIFVMFLTNDALDSSFVSFEALLAREFMARGILDRFLIVCLDQTAFDQAERHWKDYSFVRHLNSAQSIARFIQHSLIAYHATLDTTTQPHVERSHELRELNRLLIQPGKQPPLGLFVSGNAGIGRRTFVRRFYSDRYPAINPVFADLQIEPLDGYDEIFQKLCAELTPQWPVRAFRARIAGFAVANESEKATQIASLFDQLVDNREAIFIRDAGGLLDHDGALQRPFRSVFLKVGKRSYPTLAFITQRMMPSRQRGQLDMVFCALASMDNDQVRQLAGALLVDERIPYTEDDLDTIVSLSDGHPFNVKFLVAKAKEYSLSIALADHTELLQWKARRGSAYLRNIDFSKSEIRVLAALRDFLVLDFDTIQRLLGGDLESVAATLTRLIDLHVVETRADSYGVAPPLRAAVQRERRFRLDGKSQQEMLDVVSETLRVEDDAQLVSVSMIRAGILANLKQNRSVPQSFSAFLLPSHQVWHARRYYDDRQWRDCIRLAKDALNAVSRLSPAGRIEASRLLCLAAARLNDQESFQEGMGMLRTWQTDSNARSNVHFLLGFNARLEGQVVSAEGHFRAALKEYDGNFSAIRELASICLVRGDVEEAERYAQKAYDVASDNAYVLDILVSVLIAKSSQPTEQMEYLFEKLEQVGQEEGRSFYETRRAEYEMKFGSAYRARELIDDAASKTPGIFGVRALKAEICLESGMLDVGKKEIDVMRASVYRGKMGERKTNLRRFLEIEASYLCLVKEYDGAKSIYNNRAVFSKEEAEGKIKVIEYEQSIGGV